MEQKGKVIIFSHENDIDGLGCVVLAKLAFSSVDYVLTPNVYVLEEKFREYLEKGLFNNYDRIFVTDLALRNPSLEMVSQDSSLSKKVLVFDHHISSIKEGLDIYDFTKIMEVDEFGNKRCGTDLFYDYLCLNGFLTRAESFDVFVELTRLEDTWEWKNKGLLGVKAHDLAILLNGMSTHEYVNVIYQKLKSNNLEFEFTAAESCIIDKKKQEYLHTLEEIWKKAEFFVDEFKNKYAGVFASYECRNELSEYVRGLNDSGLKYLVLIALEKGENGQKSYRAIAEGFDVGVIAEAHGGGGHPAAASVNITAEQREMALILQKKSTRASIHYLTNCSYK